MSSNKHRIHAQNLEALDAAHPGVAATVSASDPPADAEYAQDPATGIVSLKASGAYVHSARNPIREAGRLIEDLKKTSGLRVAVFFGFGLGYHVEAALDQCPDLHCVVYEADPSLLNESLRWRDLRHVLGHERLSLFTACPPENVAMLLRNMHRSQVYAVRLRSLYTRDASAYERLDKVIDDTFRRRDVNRATLKRFGRRWIVNLVANLSVMARARRVSELESFFRGVPAFVLAGGPSLDAIVPFLDRIAERCVLIAVDTSLVAALRRGIDPDYTIIVDPQYWNSRHLDLCRNSRTILVSESSTHPRVFKLLGTRTYMCSSLFPLGQYLEQPLGAFGSLGAGGSVSTTAWDFARHIGAENIYCAGLDLGFPGRNTHFRGSFFEERSLTWCDRMHPTETMAWRYLNSGTPFYTQDFTGGRVMTDERMRVYHWWFENQMALHPDVTTWNLNPHAVGIPGMKTATIEELLELPVRRHEIDTRIASRSEDPPGEPWTERTRLLREQLHTLSVQLETLGRYCTIAMSLLSRESPDIQALDRIDAKIMSVDARDVAGFLVQHAVEDAMLDPGLHPHEKSRRIYRSILESVERHREFIAQET